jgi:hypothetical protein
MPAPPRLLRGHVAGRPHDGPGEGVPRVGLEPRCQAEVGNLRHPIAGQQDVRGLQVAVDNPVAMGHVYRPRDNLDEGGRPAWILRLPARPLLQAPAIHIFEGEIRQPPRVADLVDLDDVRVDQSRDGLGLGEEPGLLLDPGVLSRQHHLEGHDAIEGEVMGLVDHPHPSPAEHVEDLVTGDGPARARACARVPGRRGLFVAGFGRGEMERHQRRRARVRGCRRVSECDGMVGVDWCRHIPGGCHRVDRRRRARRSRPGVCSGSVAGAPARAASRRGA